MKVPMAAAILAISPAIISRKRIQHPVMEVRQIFLLQKATTTVFAVDILQSRAVPSNPRPPKPASLPPNPRSTPNTRAQERTNHLPIIYTQLNMEK